MAQSADVQGFSNERPGSLLGLVAFLQWIMVLPATVFLATGILSSVQPHEFEPAHTSWIVFEWGRAHLSPPAGAALFLVFPSLVILAGSSVLLRMWNQDERWREDIKTMFGFLRRRATTCLLAAATFVAGAVAVAAVAHIITD